MVNGIGGNSAASQFIAQMLNSDLTGGQVSDADGDVSDSSGNSLSSLTAKIKMAQTGGIDKASTVLDLLHELRDSDNPVLARIGKELNQIDSRIGGTFSGAKQDYLLNQAMALLTAQQGGKEAETYRPKGNAASFDGRW